MGDLINLKRFKKRIDREKSAKQADANRAKFGQSKTERSAEKKRTERATELLNQHLVDNGDAS